MVELFHFLDLLILRHNINYYAVILNLIQLLFVLVLEKEMHLILHLFQVSLENLLQLRIFQTSLLITRSLRYSLHNPRNQIKFALFVLNEVKKTFQMLKI